MDTLSPDEGLYDVEFPVGDDYIGVLAGLQRTLRAVDAHRAGRIEGGHVHHLVKRQARVPAVVAHGAIHRQAAPGNGAVGKATADAVHDHPLAGLIVGAVGPTFLWRNKL